MKSKNYTYLFKDFFSPLKLELRISQFFDPVQWMWCLRHKNTFQSFQKLKKNPEMKNEFHVHWTQNTPVLKVDLKVIWKNVQLNNNFNQVTYQNKWIFPKNVLNTVHYWHYPVLQVTNFKLYNFLDRPQLPGTGMFTI